MHISVGQVYKLPVPNYNQYYIKLGFDIFIDFSWKEKKLRAEFIN